MLNDKRILFDYVIQLTGNQQIYAILGGLHLLNATGQRIAETIRTLTTGFITDYRY